MQTNLEELAPQIAALKKTTLSLWRHSFQLLFGKHITHGVSAIARLHGRTCYQIGHIAP